MARQKLSPVPGTSNQHQQEDRRQRRRVSRSPAGPVSRRTRQRDRIAAQQQAEEVLNLPVPQRPTQPGSVLTVGTGDIGQLGLGTGVLEALRPRKVNLPFPVVDIAAGGMHTVILSADGQVFTFGCNDEKALGRYTTGNEDCQFLFDLVILPERIVQISAGDSHTAALSEQGAVYLWGNFRDTKGPMGLAADGESHQVPIRILNGVTVVQISSGCDHLACLSNKGTLYTCGNGEQGQLGRISRYNLERGGRRGIGSLLEPAPVVVGRVRGRPRPHFDQVWTGLYSTLARDRQTGEVYAFGLNNANQLGIDEEADNLIVTMPQKAVSLLCAHWSMISGGQHHTIALSNQGEAYALGFKEYGRLGLGRGCENQKEPTLIPTTHNQRFVQVATGDHVSFAISSRGTLYSWGMGTNGQLGHGTIDDVYSPTAVHSNAVAQKKILKVDGGGQHTVILIEN